MGNLFMDFVPNFIIALDEKNSKRKYLPQSEMFSMERPRGGSSTSCLPENSIIDC